MATKICELTCILTVNSYSSALLNRISRHLSRVLMRTWGPLRGIGTRFFICTKNRRRVSRRHQKKAHSKSTALIAFMLFVFTTDHAYAWNLWHHCRHNMLRRPQRRCGHHNMRWGPQRRHNALGAGNVLQADQGWEQFDTVRRE